jgi:hypothetical protein
MPIALPISLSRKIVDPAGSHYGQGVTWIIAVWAIALLLFTAIANVGTDTGAMDPFQLLATF